MAEEEKKRKQSEERKEKKRKEKEEKKKKKKEEQKSKGNKKKKNTKSRDHTNNYSGSDEEKNNEASGSDSNPDANPDSGSDSESEETVEHVESFKEFHDEWKEKYNFDKTISDSHIIAEGTVVPLKIMFGPMKGKYIYSIALDSYQDYSNQNNLMEAVTNVCKHVVLHTNAKSISFPPLGTGQVGMPIKNSVEALNEGFCSFDKWLHGNKENSYKILCKRLEEDKFVIQILIFDTSTFYEYKDECQAIDLIEDSDQCSEEETEEQILEDYYKSKEGRRRNTSSSDDEEFP